jgi:hypothetical protein
MDEPMNADQIISDYMARFPEPADYRVLFAAVLMQVKRDIHYAGKNGRILMHTLDACRWMQGMGDPAGITFRMCCEALNIDEKTVTRYLTQPHKGRRPWNGRSVRTAECTPPSEVTCSKSKPRSSRKKRDSAFARFAARHPSIYSRPTTSSSVA